MLGIDFDKIGRLASVRYAKGNQASNNYSALGKYFVSLGRDVKSQQDGQFHTKYYGFVMWNNSDNMRVKNLMTYSGIGDVVEVAGKMTDEHKGNNGVWYHSENNITRFTRIARSYKHLQADRARQPMNQNRSYMNHRPNTALNASFNQSAHNQTHEYHQPAKKTNPNPLFKPKNQSKPESNQPLSSTTNQQGSLNLGKKTGNQHPDNPLANPNNKKINISDDDLPF